jgi:hypothetical protein
MEADEVRRAFAGLREALEAYLPERASADEVIDRVVPWEAPRCRNCGVRDPLAGVTWEPVPDYLRPAAGEPYDAPPDCRRVAPGDTLWITDREGGDLARVVVQGVTFYRPAGSGIDSIILRVSEQ